MKCPHCGQPVGASDAGGGHGLDDALRQLRQDEEDRETPDEERLEGDSGDDDDDLSDLLGDAGLRDEVMGETDDLFGDDIDEKLDPKKKPKADLEISIIAGKPKKGGGRFGR